jgi:hypothetical protein
LTFLPFSFRTIDGSCFLPNAPPPTAPPQLQQIVMEPLQTPPPSPRPSLLLLLSATASASAARSSARGCSISRHRPARRSRRHLPRRVSRSDSHRRWSGGAHCRWAHCRRLGRTRRTRRRRGGRRHARTSCSSSRGGKGTAPLAHPRLLQHLEPQD